VFHIFNPEAIVLISFLNLNAKHECEPKYIGITTIIVVLKVFIFFIDISIYSYECFVFKL